MNRQSESYTVYNLNDVLLSYYVNKVKAIMFTWLFRCFWNERFLLFKDLFDFYIPTGFSKPWF